MRSLLRTTKERTGAGVRLSATMSSATASIADVSRTDFANTDDGRDRNKSGETEGNREPNGVQFTLELSL